MKLTVVLVTCFICAPVLAAEPTADDYFKFFTPILGDSWDVTFRSGSDSAVGQFSCKLSPAGKCVIESAGEVGSFPAYDGVSGFDPETKKWKSCFFNTKGECVTRYCYTPKLEGNEATFQVEVLNVASSGQVTKEKASWRVKIVSPKRWEIHATDMTRNGQKQPDLEAVFERK